MLELVSIDLGSGGLTRLTKHIPWDVIELALSPDRRLAAVVTNEAGVFTLHVIDIETQRERHLPKLRGWVTNTHWRRNGRDLGFSLDSSRAPADIYSLDIASGNVTRWTSGETGGIDLSSFAEPRLIEWSRFTADRTTSSRRIFSIAGTTC